MHITQLLLQPADELKASTEESTADDLCSTSTEQTKLFKTSTGIVPG